MKLGILVVYMLTEDFEPLLDLHFQQIEQHTSVPYTIYGVAKRFPESLMPKLQNHPRIKLFDIEERRAPDNSIEHSHYMQELTERAIADGATHLCCLHVDSFPVRPGWAEYLDSLLDEETVLAAVLSTENGDFVRPNACAMFYRAAFYEEHRPRFLITDEVRNSEHFKKWCADAGQRTIETGIGFGYLIDQQGLKWHKMLHSNKRSDHYLIASLYEDIFFHLSAASRVGKGFEGDRAQIQQSKGAPFWRKLNSVLSSFLPAAVMTRLRSLLPARTLFLIHPPAGNWKAFLKIRKRLFTEGQDYLDYLAGRRLSDWPLTPKAAEGGESAQRPVEAPSGG